MEIQTDLVIITAPLNILLMVMEEVEEGMEMEMEGGGMPQEGVGEAVVEVGEAEDQMIMIMVIRTKRERKSEKTTLPHPHQVVLGQKVLHLIPNGAAGIAAIVDMAVAVVQIK